MKYLLYNGEKGGAALLVVIIVCATALLLTLGASRLGLGELESGYVSQKGDEAFYFGDGCAEEALERLRVNPNYGGGTLSLGGESCTISITANGSSRTITVNTSSSGFNKKIQLVVILGGAITINSWSEIPL